MTRIERRWIVILLVTAVFLWAAVLYEFVQTWQQPLGPSMALPTYTSAPLVEIPDTAVPSPRPPAGPTNTMIP